MWQTKYSMPYDFLFQPFCLLVYLGSLSCCMAQFGLSFTCWTHGLLLDSKIIRYTEEFMVDSVSEWCPGPVAEK